MPQLCVSGEIDLTVVESEKLSCYCLRTGKLEIEVIGEALREFIRSKCSLSEKAIENGEGPDPRPTV